MPKYCLLPLLILLYGCSAESIYEEAESVDLVIENNINREVSKSFNSQPISGSDEDPLIRVCYEESICGYLNSVGDTMIPFGKYMVCQTDTFYSLAIVITHEYEWIGIDRSDNKLFDIFIFDNGPDYVKDGLFRIEKDGRIGYANEAGEIVIEQIYTCAHPFKNGRAKVALEGTVEQHGEHWNWVSDEWFYIDLNGNRILE